MKQSKSGKPVMIIIRKPRTIEEMEKYYDVRFRMLRKPLGMERESEKAKPPINEISGIHLFAFIPTEQKVVGTVMGFIGKEYAKVHALCVLPEYRSCGLGKALMISLEDEFRKRGAAKVYLNSRVPTQKLYEKLGYIAVKTMTIEESLKITGMDIIFVRMEKSLIGTKI